MNENCHCGAVKCSNASLPAQLADCNFSPWRRLRPLWAHGPDGVITIGRGEGRNFVAVLPNLRLHDPLAKGKSLGSAKHGGEYGTLRSSRNSPNSRAAL